MVSGLTGAEAGMAYGLVGVSVLLLLGKTRGALVFTIIAMSIGFVSIMGDYTLGEIVDRSRPEAAAASSAPSFPSGHVFGSMVFFGFMAFLAVYHRLEMNLLVPMLAVLGALVVLVGPARVHESSHWPTDVAAGYLLGAIWLLVLAPVYIYARNTKFIASRAPTLVQVTEDSEAPRMASSIASLVWLDPKQGTASKIYKPPAVVRIIYWLAFQAKFPYIGNRAALEAAGHRRKVASLITKHRFGQDMVSPVLAVNERGDKFEFVTEYVAGKEAENDDTAKELLGQISKAFAEAGLSVWQVNPHNPHAHTNLILTADGDYKIIDLESSLATPFLPKGQRLSALKAGNFPVFDDVDLPKLRGYVAANSADLTASLGTQGVAELEQATEKLEASIRAWKGGELRIWGRIASLVYRIFNWEGAYQATARAVQGGEQAAQTFLSAGIDRWSREGRLAPSEARELHLPGLARGQRRPAPSGGSPDPNCHLPVPPGQLATAGLDGDFLGDDSAGVAPWKESSGNCRRFEHPQSAGHGAVLDTGIWLHRLHGGPPAAAEDTGPAHTRPDLDEAAVPALRPPPPRPVVGPIREKGRGWTSEARRNHKEVIHGVGLVIHRRAGAIHIPSRIIDWRPPQRWPL